MHEQSATSLINLLRSKELTIRTGLLLLPPYALGHEAEVAAHFGLGHQDICAWILGNTPTGRNTLGLSSELILDVLTEVVSDVAIPGRCILISNVDLLLAGIDDQDKVHFWNFYRNSFRRERGVVLCFPEKAFNLLPIEERKSWEAIERIATWTGEDGNES